MIAWWNQLFGGFVWGNRSLGGFVASLLCGIDRLVDSLRDWSLGGIDRLVELIALWIRLVESIVWWNWSLGGIDCFVDSLGGLIAWWNQLFGGIDRLVELIALWNWSLCGIGGFAWGIDRLVESLCVESIAWWNWFLWRRIRKTQWRRWIQSERALWNRSLCGIHSIGTIRSDSYSFSLFGSVACMYSC